MRHPLQNIRGQALVEATVLTSVFCVGFIFLLAVFHVQIVSVAVDDALEYYFFCKIQKKNFCKNLLEDSLNHLKLINTKTHEVILNKDYEITIEAETNYHYQIYKQRRLRFDFDLQI